MLTFEVFSWETDQESVRPRRAIRQNITTVIVRATGLHYTLEEAVNDDTDRMGYRNRMSEEAAAVEREPLNEGLTKCRATGPLVLREIQQLLVQIIERLVSSSGGSKLLRPSSDLGGHACQFPPRPSRELGTGAKWL